MLMPTAYIRNNPFAASNPLQTLALMQNHEGVNRFISGLGLEAVFQRSEKSVTKFVGGGGFDFYSLQTNVLVPGRTSISIGE